MKHRPTRTIAALAAQFLALGLAAMLAPAASAGPGTAATAAGEACGLPVFLGDVEGDGSGVVRIGTERGGCAELVSVACEEDVLVVSHAPAGTDETTVHHPSDGDVACDDVRVIRVRVFGGSDRVALAGLDELTGLVRSEGRWPVDVDLGRGEDRFRGSVTDEEVDGGPGNDRVHGDGGSDLLLGGPGHDRLFGERGHDFLVGGAGRDELFGGAGRDCLFQENGGHCISGGGPPR